MLQQIKNELRLFIARQPAFVLGHGFLWAYYNGNRTLLAVIDGRSNHSAIVAKANSFPGVTGAWINLD